MSQITGMAIRNADATPNGTGIRIQPGAGGLAVTGIVIAGCWIGMDDTGTSGGQANANDIGISINSSTNNLIGGTTTAARNVICNNGLEGIALQAGANNNQVLGNYIGVSPDGTVRLRNNFGIYDLVPPGIPLARWEAAETLSLETATMASRSTSL